MRRLIIYVHGKGGSAEEAKHYRPLFPDSDVIGFDYCAQTPWEVNCPSLCGQYKNTPM